ncbi:MAG: hypothetical protein K0B15_07370 [Lentimicrobium sp.]|nr:hypothetical protein [Lentimicrobium sp.]
MKTTINKDKKETGSFFNLIMGNNNSIPVVGKGATVLLWTDREAYEVTEVDEAKKTCTIQRYAPERTDSHGMSDCQGYKYEKLTDEVKHLVYRQKAWRQIIHSVTYTKEFMEKHPDTYSFSRVLTQEQKDAIYAGEVYPKNVVEGFTREKITYSKINIIFGVLKEYYDYSF